MKDNPNGLKAGDLAILDVGLINGKVLIKEITPNEKIATIVTLMRKSEPWDVKINRLTPIK